LALTVLLLEAGRVVATDRLIEELWGDELPVDPAAALRNQLSRLRRVLGPAAADLVTEAGGYRLRLERPQLDAARFEELLVSARQANGHEALALLDQALGLWRGPALGEFADRPFAQPEAVRLEELRLAAQEQRAERLLGLGRAGDAVVSLGALLAEHPHREGARALLMEGLYRQGRHTEALAAYQSWRCYLAEELGLDPSPALQRLERDILRHSLSTDEESDAAAARPPAASSGPLTFLFTDIEGSTRRWKQQTETMATDLAHHDALLRQVIEANGGHVFKHTGDGCCAVFPSASAGLSAAVAGQLALSAEQWGPGGPLRARMVLHTGPAESRGGDYFGPTLNRAARLLALAHGGQTVLSLTTRELVVDDLPAGFSLRDLGEHRLADLDRPENVFQVDHPELPGHFPPLRSVESHRHNLPVALSPFVGRRAELEELVQRLDSSRLLTLTGVGGAGKTRLAIQLAAQVLPGFRDGAFLVEFAPLTDAALVPRQVAAALGMAVEGVETLPALVDRLGRYLEDRHLLLLFDNCEHLVGAIAALTETILARCAKAVVLATSREPLGISGERIWRVPSLSLPPAEASTPEALAATDGVALLCLRAREAAPDFALTPANAPAVGQICRRLDGIPLAIELAAARLRHLSPAQLAERLDDRFRLLTGGARTGLPRHQTLLAAMEWSYQLLSEAERAVLRRLSVFPAGFSLEAAEAVGSAPGGVAAAEVLEVLGHLVDKSLVVAEHRSNEVRYRLLETVRQYAAERLGDAGEVEATRRRHRDFFVASADHALADLSFFWDGRRWLPRVRADHDNFWTALEWSRAAGEPESCLRFSVALSYYWFLEGVFAGKTWLEWALEETAGLPPAPVRIRGLVALAFVVLPRGEGDRAVALLEEARSLAETIGDITGGGMAREVLGVLKYWRGEVDAAKELLEEARRRFDGEDCDCGAWACGFDLGYLAMAKGDQQRARAEFEQALEVSRSSGSEDLIAHSLAALAPLVALDDEAEQAEALAEEAIEVARAVGLRLFQVMALVRAAEVAVILGHMDRAREVLLESLSLLRDIGGDAWVADALELAALVQADGDPRQAARLLGTCGALAGASDGSPSVRAIRDQIERCRAELSETLGPDAFAVEFDRGRETPVDLAVTDVLSRLGYPGSRPV
jgi:predicted ATPase/class 3 adenylate cyclase